MPPALSLNDAIDEYLNDLKVLKSPHTWGVAHIALTRFLDYVARRQPEALGDIEALSPRTVRLFSGHLVDHGLQKASVATYLVPVRCLLKYVLKTNPGLDIPPPDIIELPELADRVPIPDERLPDMLRLATEDAEDATTWRLTRMRDRAMLETLYATGIRVSELVGLDRRDVNFELGVARVFGKGQKERPVVLSPGAILALREYLAARDDAVDALFVAHDNAAHSRDHEPQRLTPRTVQRRIQRLATELGIKATPHSFRHLVATVMIENGADVRTVQELLGHAALQTTQRYTHVRPTRLIDEVRRHHPGHTPPAPSSDEA